MMAARSKAWTVFARSYTRIVGSNPTWGMDVCVRLFYVRAVLCAGTDPPSKDSYRLYEIWRNRKSDQGPT
jgi:hypothetical protein